MRQAFLSSKVRFCFQAVELCGTTYWYQGVTQRRDVQGEFPKLRVTYLWFSYVAPFHFLSLMFLAVF